MLEERECWRNLGIARHAFTEIDPHICVKFASTPEEFITVFENTQGLKNQRERFNGVVIPAEPSDRTWENLEAEMFKIDPDVLVGVMVNSCSEEPTSSRPILHVPFNKEDVREFLMKCPRSRV
jgi:hypothetical protein